MSVVPQITRKPSHATAVRILHAAHLPAEDLTPTHCEHFFCAGPATEPTGLVGLELYGDVALLRSLVVAPDRRGAGEGAALLRHAEGHARAHGIRTVYLLTTSAETFFTKHGYRRVARESAPASIRATREFAGLCPSSSAFMSRELS
jgi:amino-acid N-acetyltransferase